MTVSQTGIAKDLPGKRDKGTRRHRSHAYAHTHVGMTCLLIINCQFSILNKKISIFAP